ncbi:transporter substrate-binding domain-containing protein [Aggregatilineales bacterium SYSU G02658]
MKKRLSLIVTCLLVGWGTLWAQQPAPTLVPPTLVPTPVRSVLDTVPTESAIARILRSGQVRVGVLFNEPPFGELTVRDEVRGFDADLARKMAELWGVEVVFVQVTRQNGLDMVRSGAIDLLIGAQVRRRELDALVEFSLPYRISRQAVMVRNDDPAETLFNLTNRKLSYVLGTPSEGALRQWQARTGITLNTQSFLTLDLALSALFAGEVDGVVGRAEDLLRVAADQVFSARVLEDVIEPEPFAIAMQRQDVNLRNLVDRTLQYLNTSASAPGSGTFLESLYATYFSGQAIAVDTLPIYDNIGDSAPRPEQFGQDIRFPAQYALPRMLEERVVRVAGLFPPSEGASDADRRLYEVNRQLVEALAERWGMRVELVEGGDVFELLELGLADMAVGVTLDWNYASRVDFSQPYAFFGDRLMVKARSTISGFNELRGRWVGIMSGDTGAQERAQAWASSINATVRFYTTTEQSAADAMLRENNADVIYGTSLKLLQHLAANPDDLRLTDRWYSRRYLGFAVPRNDIDKRLLIDYTLQELVEEGALNTLIAPLMPPGSEMPQFLMLPGRDEYFGLKLSR